jgi:hypothetical protein
MMRWPVQFKPRWRQWFAWHPVRIGNQWVWWEVVERELVCPELGGAWHYRLAAPEKAALSAADATRRDDGGEERS